MGIKIHETEFKYRLRNPAISDQNNIKTLGGLKPCSCYKHKFQTPQITITGADAASIISLKIYEILQ